MLEDGKHRVNRQCTLHPATEWSKPSQPYLVKPPLNGHISTGGGILSPLRLQITGSTRVAEIRVTLPNSCKAWARSRIAGGLAAAPWKPIFAYRNADRAR